VLAVAVLWFASARTKGYLWHLPAGLVDRLVGLHPANLAEGAGQEAVAYCRELVDLHQSFHRAAAGPYPAGRVGGEEEEAAWALVHCDKRLVHGRIRLREGLGDKPTPTLRG